MIKNVIILFFLFSSIYLYPAVNNNDVSGDYNLNGIINIKASGLEYRLDYEGKKIFCILKQNLNINKIEINIGEQKYAGKIWSIEGFIMPDYYQLKFNLDNEEFNGEVKIKKMQFSKTYRKEEFKIIKDNEFFEWIVDYKYDKIFYIITYLINLPDRIITGEAITKKNETFYDFKFGETGRLKGKYIERNFKDNLLNINANNLTSKDLFVFFLLHIYNYIINQEKEDQR